jgi:hypothetical protein
MEYGPLRRPLCRQRDRAISAPNPPILFDCWDRGRDLLDRHSWLQRLDISRDRTTLASTQPGDTLHLPNFLECDYLSIFSTGTRLERIERSADWLPPGIACRFPSDNRTSRQQFDTALAARKASPTIKTEDRPCEVATRPKPGRKASRSGASYNFDAPDLRRYALSAASMGEPAAISTPRVSRSIVAPTIEVIAAMPIGYHKPYAICRAAVIVTSITTAIMAYGVEQDTTTVSTRTPNPTIQYPLFPRLINYRGRFLESSTGSGA